MQHDDFPVDRFPPLLRDTIYEVHQITKAPIPLIGASALGALSLACQNSINVVRPGNLCGPVSLYLLTLAESGERKSTVDTLLLNPLMQVEKRLSDEFTRQQELYRVDADIASAEIKGLKSALKSQNRRGQDTDVVKARLEQALHAFPSSPVNKRLIFNDATPAALKAYLGGEWRSVGIMSDEAGIVFNGHSLSELPFINKMWDGADITVDRKKEEVIIRHARMTLSLMLQPEVFRAYLSRKGNQAKGVGFFARCLISYPHSMQGWRTITAPPAPPVHLPEFHQQLATIMQESLHANASERTRLTMTPDAQAYWLWCYNQAEDAMKDGGALSGIRDYASKIPENIARVAALLHHFSERDTAISQNAVETAASLVTWYSHEYREFFTPAVRTDSPEHDAAELYQWICQKVWYTGNNFVRKSHIQQYGPHRLRKTDRLNEVLLLLAEQGKITLSIKNNKTQYVHLNRAFNFF